MDHAVVVRAGIAGLTACLVLSRVSDRITLGLRLRQALVSGPEET